MKIFLVRHGETEENSRHIIQGTFDGKLSARGMEQIKKVASRLSSERIDVVFSSPLERADLTAQEIAKQHSANIIYDERLTERNHGTLEGSHRNKYFEEIKKSPVPRHEFKPSGGESYIDVRKRLESFYKMLLEKYPEKNVLIVAHGTVNRVFLSIAGHVSIEDAFGVDQDNTCINIIEIAGGKPHVRLVNCTKHLG